MAEPKKLNLLQRFIMHIPPDQLVRYLIVGVWNTLFGYSTFAALNWFLYHRGVPVSYIWAQVLSNFVNITVAFLGYKFFVFKTRGNYLREWMKAMAVFWSGFPLGIALLAGVVRLLNWILPLQLMAFHHIVATNVAAPYIGNALVMGLGTIYSFLGHKNVTFRQKPTA